MDTPAVQYVRSGGSSIACAVIGEGIPYVFMPPPVSHIQLAWDQNSNVRAWLDGLVSQFRLIQYDSRGQGMSSRGLPEDYVLGDLTRDLEAVIRHLKLKQFVLMGSHISAHTAVRFAVEHPEQVCALVLAPCGVSGGRWPMINAIELARENWEFFLTFYVMNFVASTAVATGAPLPHRGQREIEVIKQSVTQRDWHIMARVWSTSSIEGDLARLVTPTLVLHPRNYLNIPSELSMSLASRIPNARMALIEGNTALGDATTGCAAIEGFLKDVERPAARVSRQVSDLSAREVEVLRLISTGRSNQQIANELVISLSTVLHHITSILTKTGCANRTEAAAYAIRNGIV
jgi:DNA-binding CsgD family transcriptional regulator/pimeloyl-ACP methyl ester carboxylesterase